MDLRRRKGRKALPTARQPSARQRRRSAFERLEERRLLTSGYLQLNLVSDQANTALVQDANLVAAWGSGLNPNAGAFWVADQGANVATLYSGDVSGSPFAKNPLVVSVPGSPTGVTFNGTSDFQITSGGSSGPATFLFDGASGQVSGWNTNVPPGSASAISGATTANAVYKGLAAANNGGTNYIYAANFHASTVDVFNTNFQPVSLGAGAFPGTFTDASIPAGFAPFNIEDLNNQLYVTYAKQDANKQNDVPGPGNGFVDVFNPNGTLVKSLIVGQPGTFGSPLNSPYGVALAPANFGDFSNDLLVANSGDGLINAFDPTTGALLGTLSSTNMGPLTINGLKDLRFGNGQTAGDANTLFFTAAPAGGTHGLFGSIQSAQATNLTAEGAVFGATLNTAFNGPVATFADQFSGLQASNFTATIYWGDGQTSAGSVVALTAGGFNVTGSHTYTQSGTFNASVTITDPMQNTAVAASQAVVTVAPLLMVGATLSMTEGAGFSGTVATLTDTDGNQNAAAYTASVVWGDGTTTTPTLVPNGTGFDIRATHTYSEEGNDAIVVHVSDTADGNAGSVNSLAKVADAPLSGAGTTIAATEGTSSTFTVATFTDANPNGVASDFTAKIQWGDGSSAVGTVSASGGGFVVKAAHTYADEMTGTVTVSIADAGGGTTTVRSTATVADADVLVGLPAVVTPTEGLAVTGAVATFSDTFTGNTPADFTATINWGDGTTDTGTVTGANGLFSVHGNHTYADEKTYNAVVTLSDDAPGAATFTLNRTIVVADGDALSASVVPFAPTEGLVFNGNVATISDVNTQNTAADFTATIVWGDGATDTGTITGSAGNFQVSGSHTYLEETTAPFKVTFADDAPGTASTSATASLVVADAPLTVTPATFSSTEHSTFTGSVATFTDADPHGTLADYKATIDWGDGTTGSGTVASNGGGGYSVTGTHSYTEGGSFNVGVLVNDQGGASAGAISTANIADFPLHATAAASIQGSEGSMFRGTVATFTDADPDGGSLGEYHVSIDWGDGTTSAGTVSGAGPYTVTGSHTFADESTGVKAVITDAGGATASATTAATVAEADSLAGTGSSGAAHAGETLSGTLATFTDTYTGNSASDFTAAVVWGDGATTAGTVAGSGGSFTVSGSHVYSNSGTFSARVVLADDAPGTATATATYTARISPATITLTAMAVNEPEYALLSVPVATFTEAAPTDPVGNFNATIDWGDGGTSAGTVTVNAGVFTISGAHTYADEAHYQVTVVAAAKGGNAATGQSTATIVEELLAGGGGAGTANQRWINEQYNDLLGRAADAGGLAFWSAQLDAGASRASVVAALTQSQEYRQDEVRAVFERYLHRAADPAGETFFAAYLQSHTVEQLSAAVAGSPEYFNVRGGGGNDGFLSALYHDALGRPVDAAGRQYFDQLLASGETTGQVAATVLAGEEYLDDVVKGIYLQFLDRPADPGGLAYWAGELQNGARDEQVIAAIAASSEDFAKTA